MENCRILLTRSMLPGDIRYLRDGLDRTVPGRYDFLIPERFDEEQLLALAPEADVFLGPYVTERLLDGAKALKLIQIPWTGTDTFDFNVLRSFGEKNGRVPTVCNTHSNADAVAELGMGLLLDLLKKISYHDRKMRLGSWNREQEPLTLKSPMLSQQTVCILGLGNIGGRIARLCKAFGAKVIGTGGRTLPSETVDEVFPRERMAEAVGVADIVVCCLPLTESTRGLLGKELLRGMKPGTLLVNMSRAAVIDEDAVFEALLRGQLGGFAADVWWNAPKRGESQSWPSTHNRFQDLDNVVMSPHRAGFVEGSLPHLDGAIENIAALILERPLSSIVDITRAY